MTIQELEQNIIQLATDRGIFEHTTPVDQLVKTIEEFGELARAVNKQNRDALIDGYGDIMVTLIIGMHSCGLDYFLSRNSGSFPHDGKHPTEEKEIILLITAYLGDLSADIAFNRAYPIFCYGDTIRVIEYAIHNHGLTVEQCLLAAWNEIKDRKGKVIGGTFVKEADLS